MLVCYVEPSLTLVLLEWSSCVCLNSNSKEVRINEQGS